MRPWPWSPTSRRPGATRNPVDGCPRDVYAPCIPTGTRAAAAIPRAPSARSLPSPEGDISLMPGPGNDQRDQRAQRNRRPRRRAPIGGGGRAPVTEFEEQQELEAARERNDLEVGDLREMSVAELKQVSRDLELETAAGERKDDLVD